MMGCMDGCADILLLSLSAHSPELVSSAAQAKTKAPTDGGFGPRNQRETLRCYGHRRRDFRLRQSSPKACQIRRIELQPRELSHEEICCDTEHKNRQPPSMAHGVLDAFR